jgi:hypothetical protein
MTDDRLTSALRSLELDVDGPGVDAALERVERAARQRRLRRRAVTVGAAAAAVLIVGVVGVVDDTTSEQSVVVDSPTTTTAATPTSTTTSTTTTPPPSTPSDPVLGTIADLAGGVTGLELSTWATPGDPYWNGLWRAEADVAEAVAAALLDADGVPMPPRRSLASMQFELADGRFVAGAIDLESGWIGSADATGRPADSGGMLPDDIARHIRTSFDDAVATAWEPVEPNEPHMIDLIARAGFPLSDLDGAAAEIQQSLQASAEWEYESWFVDVVIEGHGPFVNVRQRGLGDDSARGFDTRLALVDTADGWQVSGALTRVLCTRGNPTPESPGCI